MLSAMDSGNGAGRWNNRPTRRRSCRGSADATASPPTVIRPVTRASASRSCIRLMASSSDDLPAPEGPTRAVQPPAATVRSTPPDREAIAVGDPHPLEG